MLIICSFLSSVKNISSSISHINDLLDEELKLFFFNNPLTQALSTLERLSSSYHSAFYTNSSKSTLFEKIDVYPTIRILRKE